MKQLKRNLQRRRHTFQFLVEKENKTKQIKLFQLKRIK